MAGDGAESGARGPELDRSSDRPDAFIATLAACQHGVVARCQLLDAGVGSEAIKHRCRNGRLHRVHRGVYAVGHDHLTREGRLMAAVLTIGRDAVISHRSAAAQHGFRGSSRGVIEITGPTKLRGRSGLELHCRRLPDDEKMVLDGIPVTTVSRTLLDLAAVLPRRQVEHAVREAEFRRLTDPLSLEHLIARYPRRRGVGVLRAVLAEGHAGFGVPREELERRFQDLVTAAGLPTPRLNRHVEAAGRLLECDCVWTAQRLIVELDGRGAHATSHAFERDRRRDRDLVVAGWRVVRLSWRQVTRERGAVVRDLRRLLSAPAAGLIA